jgi:hypothetical protein
MGLGFASFELTVAQQLNEARTEKEMQRCEELEMRLE